MASLLYSSNKSIINAHIDNNSTTSSSIALKFSGKGLLNTSNSLNNYDLFGIGFQLLSNTSNHKELAIIDASNYFINSNYPSLRIGITEPYITIKTQTSNNNYTSLLINSNITITSNYIGIGTNSPNSSLDIRGDLTLSGIIRKLDGSALTASQWSNSTLNQWSSSNIYYNQGFVGIGTTNPISSLDIRGDLTLAGVIRKLDGTIFNESQWSNSTITSNSIYYNQGFVGIGTTNPQSILHIHSPFNNSNVMIQFTNSNTNSLNNDGFIIGLTSNNDGLLWNYENASIILGTSNEERLRIIGNGRIGIGTTLPLSSLDIRGDLTLSGFIRKPDGTIFNETQWSNSTINQWSSSNIYYNQGFVGIGITNPISLLDVRGDLTLAGVIRKLDGTIFNESQWSNSTITPNSIYYNQGFIGIGTTNPQSILHIHSPFNNSNIMIQFTNSNTTSSSNDGFIIGLTSNNDGLLWNYENASIILGTSNQERLRITGNGRIGIGTTLPLSSLDIRGDITLGGRILNQDGSLYTFTQWSNTSSNIYYNQGFVGIGTTNPQALLHLAGSNANIRFTDNITLSTTNNGFIIGLDSNQNGLIWLYENSNIIIGTGNQERLRITSNGRIGIGTTTPQGILDIYGSVNITGSLIINNNQFTSNPTIRINSNVFFYDNLNQLNISNFSRITNYPNINSNTLRFTSEFINISNLIVTGNIYRSSNIFTSNIIDSTWQRSPVNNNNIYYTQGNVGIGITNPISRLDIIGDINITGKYKLNGADLTTQTQTFSDSRIKTNIQDINDDGALQQILTIEPKTYNYIETKERGTDLVYGFIAQQIREVIPEAVKIQKEFIPNVYKPYPYINNQIFTYDDLTLKLSNNDLIKIRGIDYNYLYARIVDITSNIITIDKEITGNECFIYGKEVNDFHTLDKSYIYTLNVCAIQDLYKMIIELQEKINKQDLEIQQLLSITSPKPIQPTIIENIDNYSSNSSNY